MLSIDKVHNVNETMHIGKLPESVIFVHFAGCGFIDLTFDDSNDAGKVQIERASYEHVV